jgi:hypothetical protein
LQEAASCRRGRRIQVELAVKADCRVDESQVGEGLREVPDLLAGESDVLGVHAQVVGAGQHFLERHARLVELARVGQ